MRACLNVKLVNGTGHSLLTGKPGRAPGGRRVQLSWREAKLAAGARNSETMRLKTC
jgi:hypothetical protein